MKVNNYSLELNTGNLIELDEIDIAEDGAAEGKEGLLVSVATMRQSDAWTIANLTDSKELMRRAGVGIFKSADWQGKVGIICGKGNNAGDGFVVAKLLKEDGFDCEIILLSDDFSEDGKYFFDEAVKSEVRFRNFGDDTDLTQYGSILDCIFGTGFHGDVKGIAKDAIEAINSSGAYVISADINSGLNGDSGQGSCFVKSDLTVSIGSFKYGHFKGRAKEAIKTIVNVDIGIKIV